MIAVVACTSLVLYGLTYFVLGLVDLGGSHRTSLSLLVGIAGALGAQWFLATMDKE
jgi:hypothetical protein